MWGAVLWGSDLILDTNTYLSWMACDRIVLFSSLYQKGHLSFAGPAATPRPNLARESCPDQERVTGKAHRTVVLHKEAQATEEC